MTLAFERGWQFKFEGQEFTTLVRDSSLSDTLEGGLGFEWTSSYGMDGFIEAEDLAITVVRQRYDCMTDGTPERRCVRSGAE